MPHARWMRCHWHRMHDASGVIDTVFKIWHRMHDASGVIGTVCKIWHRIHGRRTIRSALADFKGNIYQNFRVRELSYTPALQKYINLKGLPDKNFRACFVIYTACTIFASENRSYLSISISAISKKNSKKV
jgi:hypothetical protein